MRSLPALLAILSLSGCGARHADSAHPSKADSICGVIDLAPDLAMKFKPGSVLYVFAKSHPPPAPGAPLAVRREIAYGFPMKFCLSPQDTAVEGLVFQGRVFVTARISNNGNVVAAPGDLEGTEGPVGVGTDGVTVTIDKVH